MRFGTKMVIAFVFMLALSFGIGGSLLISTSISNSVTQYQDAAISTHRLITYTLSAVSAEETQDDYEQLSATLARLHAQGGQSLIAIRLSDDSGVLYLSSDAGSFNDSLTASVDDGHSAMLTFRGESGEYLIQVAGQLEIHSSILYLESVYDLSPVFAGRQYQQAIYKRLFVAVVSLGGALSWALSFWMTSPLRRLSRVTRTIASGDLSCRAVVSGRDEIGILAADFNNMAERLEGNINELRDTMRRQEEFMGGLAHELKTPMTSIIGYADLLRSHLLADADRQDAANYIFMEGRRLEVLSLKLLDLIVLKKRDFEFREVNVAHIVESAAQLLKPVLIKRGVTLVCECAGETCRAEPDLLMSLLLNLIDNARKALDSGGEIKITSQTSAGVCTLRVSDNGRGIPAPELTKIKDAFYRVDKSRSRAQGGVGLGLRLCDEIVSLHGGDITFDSEPGKGTTVTVVIKGEDVSAVF